MNITYFIRNNDNEYPEACNKATIKLTKNNSTFYGGAQWGQHTPSGVVDYINANCDELMFIVWANSLGYEMVVAEENVP